MLTHVHLKERQRAEREGHAEGIALRIHRTLSWLECSALCDDEDGRPQYGIRVGRANRDAYFDRSWSRIEVSKDGQWETFLLMPGLWSQCTEFRDSGSPQIRHWLERHSTLKEFKLSYVIKL